MRLRLRYLVPGCLILVGITVGITLALCHASPTSTSSPASQSSNSKWQPWISAASALIGATVGLAGALVVSSRQLKNAREARVEGRRSELLGEQRAAYVSLLTSSRRMRDLCLRIFDKRPCDIDPDQTLQDMSAALSMIKIICPSESSDLANEFHESILTYWRLARDHPRSAKSKWTAQKEAVMHAAVRFRKHIRLEYEATVGFDLGVLKYP